MDPARIDALSDWIVEEGLAGRGESALLAGFCERAVAAGLALARGSVLVDTLHPIYEGRAFRWAREKGELDLIEYGRSEEPEVRDHWLGSPFYRLETSGETLLRRRIDAESGAEFPILGEFHAKGMTDYVAILSRFGAEHRIGEMECAYTSWVTDRPGGFVPAEVDALVRLVPRMALAVKAASLSRIAETLVETYLGRDAGRRVLDGRIARGVADRIDAVLWFSDLEGFTRITDTARPGEIIPLLDDYADAIISAVHAAGGDVLKLIGDGILAIFTAGGRREASAAALDAAVAARAGVAELNRRREAEEQPTTGFYLGLHVGEVFYGNVGSEDRLDFTVVGPAVNEVSRIAAMCGSVDQPMLLSAAFAEAAGAGAADPRFLCVGRFALRGIAGPQELFTLDATVVEGDGRIEGQADTTGGSA